MKYEKCDRDVFIQHITTDKSDGFAKTFVSKADMQNLWDNCIGVFSDGELMGALTYTISKREPFIANLQLLHTFSKHRKKGVGKFLCESMFNIVSSKAEYVRVSADKSAIQFYENIGMKMLGKQKSGCQLSMCKIGETLATSDYSLNHKPIYAAVYRNGKGGCVEVFSEID